MGVICQASVCTFGTHTRQNFNFLSLPPSMCACTHTDTHVHAHTQTFEYSHPVPHVMDATVHTDRSFLYFSLSLSHTHTHSHVHTNSTHMHGAITRHNTFEVLHELDSNHRLLVARVGEVTPHRSATGAVVTDTPHLGRPILTATDEVVLPIGCG